MAGKTDLSTLSQLLTRAEFYFGSDTGILHLSVAFGIPSIAIVGSGAYNRFFPYGDIKKNIALVNVDSIKNFPVDTWEYPGINKLNTHPSILAISVEQAIGAISNLLKK